MKSHILPAVKLTFSCFLLLGVLYPLMLLGIGKGVAPNSGKGEVIEAGGRVVGYTCIGQNFSEDRYFWSRPSAVDYHAAGSGGSNQGPGNPDYLAKVQARLDTFLAHHPGISPERVPCELLTASGSGLDPHISPQAAMVQIARIANARSLHVRDLEMLVAQKTEEPLLGLFGPARVNVLELNLALDNLD